MTKTCNLARGGEFYLAPAIETIEVSIEQGFGASPFSAAGNLDEASDSYEM